MLLSKEVKVVVYMASSHSDKLQFLELKDSVYEAVCTEMELRETFFLLSSNSIRSLNSNNYQRRHNFSA